MKGDFMDLSPGRLVNLDHITDMQRQAGGEWKVRWSNGLIEIMPSDDGDRIQDYILHREERGPKMKIHTETAPDSLSDVPPVPEPPPMPGMTRQEAHQKKRRSPGKNPKTTPPQNK